jgi:chromate transporter
MQMEIPATKREQAQVSPTLCDLFPSFFRLGLTAFGGPAMIPYVGEFVVARWRWLDPQAYKGGVTLAQFIPGATLMQTVAYVAFG